MRNGLWWSRIVLGRHATLAARAGTVAFSWKPFCGLLEPERRGATFRWSLATGTLSSSVSGTGSKPMFLNGYLTPYPATQTWNASWSTVQSVRSIVTDRAQKGDSKSGYRSFSRWNYHQNTGPDRCAWQSDFLSIDARPSPWSARNSAVNRGGFLQNVPCRSRIWRQLVAWESRNFGDPASHPAEIEPEIPTWIWQTQLQTAALDRKLLPETEGIQAYSHAVLQNWSKLRLNDLYVGSHHQFTMNLNKP